MYVEPVRRHQNNTSPVYQIKVIFNIAQPLHKRPVRGCSFAKKSVIMSEAFLLTSEYMWLTFMGGENLPLARPVVAFCKNSARLVTGRPFFSVLNRCVIYVQLFFAVYATAVLE